MLKNKIKKNFALLIMLTFSSIVSAQPAGDTLESCVAAFRDAMQNLNASEPIGPCEYWLESKPEELPSTAPIELINERMIALAYWQYQYDACLEAAEAEYFRLTDQINVTYEECLERVPKPKE